MDRQALAQEFRELVTQHKALGSKLERMALLLTQEAEVEGSSGAVCPYDEIVAEWNARCAAVGMKRRNTPGELKARILGRWRKNPSLDIWRAAFDACARDDWWNGKRGGWRGTLESFLVPKHADRWFDEAAGAQVEPAVGPLFQAQPHEQGGPEPEKADAFLARFLADRTVPLPSGYEGFDPRPMRDVNAARYAERLTELKDFLAGDWRFDA